MRDLVAKIRGNREKARNLPLDFETGLVLGVFCAVYAGIVGGVRGVSTDLMTGRALGLLIFVFGVAGTVVGASVAGRPDFGPSKRTAAIRGVVAAIPLYATGGLLFLPVGSWFSVLPFLSVIAAALVGPPIGIFAYRLHRRRDSDEKPIDPGVELAWLKGEMLGSWTPLLVSIAILASLGVGMRALPEEITVRPPQAPTPLSIAEVVQSLPSLQATIESDPTDPEARRNLGMAQLSLGQFDAAVEQLSVAIELDSSSVTAWIALGRATYFAGYPAMSARAYWNAIRVDPAALAPNGLDRVLLDAALSSDLRDDGREP